MKKYGLLFLLASAPLLMWAQCTPDLSIVNNGVYPKTLPNGTEGVPYSQVMQFKIPKDTLTLTVDSLYILSITGGPATVNFQCNHPSCGYKGNTIGCAVLTCNVPAGSAGSYSLSVSVKAKLKSSIPLVPPVYQTFTNTLDLTIDQATGIADLWTQWKEGKITVYPNPFNSDVHLKFVAIKRQKASLEVLNMVGNQVIVKEVQIIPGMNTIDLETSGLQPGMYFIALTMEGKRRIAKAVRTN